MASGLDNPRGLTLGRGVLLIAEAGTGGDGACVPGPEGEVCLGATGAVTAVDLHGGGQFPVLTELPSLAPSGGGNANGPHDVSLDRKGLYVLIGAGTTPAGRAALGPAGALLGTLKLLGRDGVLRSVADLMAFEGANDPDGPLGGGLESNPFGLDTHSGGILVADGGANDVLLVGGGGVVPLAVLPFSRGVQPVPTTVARGRGGAIYVGQLTGAPFAAGAAGVWKLLPGRPPQLVASGFTALTDMAVGRDGSLYVLQFATGAGLEQPGALIRVRPDGRREELAAGRLTAPTGLALDRSVAYVSDHGDQPRSGEVLRIPLDCAATRRVAVDASVAPRGPRWQCTASEYSSPEERRHAGHRRGPGGAPPAPRRPGA